MAGGVTRRRALQLGAAAGALALDPAVATVATAGTGPRPATGPVRDRSFDEGWRFLRGDATGAEAPGYDDSGWRELDLPHDWSIEDLPYATSTDGGGTSDPSLLVPKVPPTEPVPPPVIGPFDTSSVGDGSVGYTIGGIGWYRKHFTLPGGDGQHVELRFDGVYQNADVWLNGSHLDFHPYGYTAFGYDLTPYLVRGGPNVLAVRVDNSGRTSRWYSGSGIYRHTWLTVTGPVRVPRWGVAVTTPVVRAARSIARVETSVANLGTGAASASVQVTVLDLPVPHPALWSPDSPDLYTSRVEVLVDGRVVDTAGTTFGIRSLEWNGADGLLLNGRQVKIDGGCVHHDNGPLGAVALDRSEERKVEILKAAGFNSIRTAHNPPSPCRTPPAS